MIDQRLWMASYVYWRTLYWVGELESATHSDAAVSNTNVHGEPPTPGSDVDATGAAGKADADPRRATPSQDASLPSEAYSDVPLISTARASA